MLKLLHTADWHLGKRFPTFPEDAQKTLSRARMNVVTTILDVARRNAVQAVLCAGDLFDEPAPGADFWEGLAKVFRNHEDQHGGGLPPVFLVPGNHDPLTEGSVWAAGHAFRARLPKWVHVVDRDDFTYDLGRDAVLYARPCRSKAGESDLAMALPAREPGDERLRIGCVHGSTFENDRTNFPIRRDAGVQRGMDYLAIGDHHSFNDASPDTPVPTVYPGAPEPCAFDEHGAGSVAIVALFRRGRRPRVDAERVAFWRWKDVICRDPRELRGLMAMENLDRHVVRLHLDMLLSVPEESEVERIVRDLQGTDATHGRVGVLLVDRANLRLQPGSGGAFPDDLPPVLRDTVSRLDRLIADSGNEFEKDKATRALAHLYKLLQTQSAPGGKVA